jgi:hypothetical protein
VFYELLCYALSRIRTYVSAPCAKLICENTDELSLMYHSWLFAEDGLGDETVERQETILVNTCRGLQCLRQSVLKRESFELPGLTIESCVGYRLECSTQMAFGLRIWT